MGCHQNQAQKLTEPVYKLDIEEKESVEFFEVLFDSIESENKVYYCLSPNNYANMSINMSHIMEHTKRLHFVISEYKKYYERDPK